MFPRTKIHPITNGVHHITWTSNSFKSLFDESAPEWRMKPSYLSKIKFSDEKLLSAKQKSREELHKLILDETGISLDSEKLTIGFARRFATYKRANLVFKNIERLREIGANNIQFVFSGKAHPKDQGGKMLIKSIYEGAKLIHDEIPVIFLQNYSMHTGLLMTAGSDIWLNNPIRPMEASGTSGMKAAMNGTPNCSILDGWWPEACIHGVNGWAIGDGEEDRNDERDSTNILDVLEKEVIPAWKNKGQWLEIMKASIATSSNFTGARMIEEYKRFYDAFETV
jgi:starch phosphorylase